MTEVLIDLYSLMYSWTATRNQIERFMVTVDMSIIDIERLVPGIPFIHSLSNSCHFRWFVETFDPKVTQCDRNGHSLLFKIGYDSDYIPFLIERGCNIHQKDVTGQSIVQFALSKQKYDFVYALLDYGASIQEALDYYDLQRHRKWNQSAIEKIRDYKMREENCKSSVTAIIFLGKKKFINRDMSKLIGATLWLTRRDEIWYQ